MKFYHLNCFKAYISIALGTRGRVAGLQSSWSCKTGIMDPRNQSPLSCLLSRVCLGIARDLPVGSCCVCDWRISPSTLSSGFIHAVAGDRIPFLQPSRLNISHVRPTPHFVDPVHLSMGASCFLGLAVGNSASVTPAVHAQDPAFSFLGEYLLELLDDGDSLLSFGGHSRRRCTDPDSSTSSPALVIFCVCAGSRPNGCEVLPHCWTRTNWTGA